MTKKRFEKRSKNWTLVRAYVVKKSLRILRLFERKFAFFCCDLQPCGSTAGNTAWRRKVNTQKWQIARERWETLAHSLSIYYILALGPRAHTWARRGSGLWTPAPRPIFQTPPPSTLFMTPPSRSPLILGGEKGESVQNVPSPDFIAAFNGIFFLPALPIFFFNTFVSISILRLYFFC